MYTNPFTPIFGGKPGFFFGRKEILGRFGAALIDQGSDYRALFLTGSRGSGKTVLLEQLSRRASQRGWRVVDLGPESTASTLVRMLVRHSEETSTVNPQVSFSFLGSGASVGGLSRSKTTTYPVQDLPIILQEVCAAERKGLLVTIDEIQKVDPGDVSTICNAFQMASRKGMDVMLAVAGLPYAHDDVIRYEGCTYLRRAAHEQIGLLPSAEIEAAFTDAMRRTNGLSLSRGALQELAEASMGHPYLVQLLGYYLVADANDSGISGDHELKAGEVGSVMPYAMEAYRQRALAPLVTELSPLEQDYLRGMAQAMGRVRVAETSSVAAALNKGQQQLSRARAGLLRRGIIIAPERGKVRFAIPYLRDYVLEEPTCDRAKQLIEEWDV